MIGLALAFFLAGCAAQVAAPRDAAPTQVDPPPKPSPTNATTDVLYVYGSGNGADARVRVFDARTGSVIRELPAGVVSRDRSTLYSTEYVNGATQTRVDMTDLATGKRLRSFTIEGAFRTLFDESFSPVGPTTDGRWLTLTHGPYKIGDDYVTQYAVVDTVAERSTSFELRHAWPYEFVAVAPDGKRVYLVEHSPYGEFGLRVFDLGSRTLRGGLGPGAEWNMSQVHVFRSSAVSSADGRWVYLVQTSVKEAPVVVALDTVEDRLQHIRLPAHQRETSDPSMYWSLVATRDGTTLYAVNPASGAISEIDTSTMSVRRSAHVPTSRQAGDVLSAVRQALFPAAEAKRMVRAGAVLSLDERTLYAAGESGMAVVDTGSLTGRTWHKGWTFDLVAMSPDGERLYALTTDAWNTVAIMDARDGAMLGGVRTPSYPLAILRIELGR